MALTQSTPASSFPNWFIDKYRDDVIHAYQQKMSKLRETITVVSAEGAKSVRFNFMGALGRPQDKARHGDIPVVEPVHSVKTVTPEPKYLGIYVSPDDEIRTNLDARQRSVEALAATLAREIDYNVFDNLDANAPAASATIPATGLANTKPLLDINEALSKSEVPMDQRYLVIPPKFMYNAMTVTELTSTDYVTMKAIMEGGIGSVLQTKWLVSNLLPSNGATAANAGKKAYAYGKESIGLAVTREPQIRIDWDTRKGEWFISGKLFIGSLILQPDGIKTLNVIGA